MTNTHTSVRRRFARLGAVALAAGALCLTGTPAVAAPEDTPPAGSGPGTGGTGSITVYKLEQTSGTLGSNDGTEIDTQGATPLEAGFTVCSISGIDLKKSVDWDRLKGINVSTDEQGSLVVTEGAPGMPLATTCDLIEKPTDPGTGAAVFADLPADRAYVVFESTPAHNAAGVAQPTLLTIPYPGNGKGSEWNYDPVIYPKSVVAGSGSEKEAEMVGNQVVFTITVPVNPLSGDQMYAQFSISDKLSDVLEYTGGEVVLVGPGETELPFDSADYTLTEPATAPGATVVLDLTEDGLAKLDANIGWKVQLVLRATAIASGTTANEAKISVNGKSTEGGSGPKVIKPEYFYGGTHIMKEARNKGTDSRVPLGGAQFEVYAAGAAAVDCPTEPASEATPVLAAQTSGSDGRTPDAVLVAGKYCVYETVTPAGYKTLQGGMLLDVTGENSAVTVINEQIGTAEGDLPALPLTGGSGTVVLMSAGAALLALGAGLFLVMRRRRDQHQPDA